MIEISGIYKNIPMAGPLIMYVNRYKLSNKKMFENLEKMFVKDSLAILVT